MGGFDGKDSACSGRDLDLIPMGGKIPLERTDYPFPVFLLGIFHGQGSPWEYKELDINEQLALLLSQYGLCFRI